MGYILSIITTKPVNTNKSCIYYASIQVNYLPNYLLRLPGCPNWVCTIKHVADGGGCF